VKPEAFVTELVQRWLAVEVERLALRMNGRAMRGYQWKNIFLPDGTNLRTTDCRTRFEDLQRNPSKREVEKSIAV
jgi:hypothetical protein